MITCSFLEYNPLTFVPSGLLIKIHLLRLGSLLLSRETCATAVCHCCVPLLCATAVCHCYVPLLCATAMCHCCVPLLCATAVCHCCVPLLCATTVCHFQATLLYNIIYTKTPLTTRGSCLSLLCWLCLENTWTTVYIHCSISNLFYQAFFRL